MAAVAQHETVRERVEHAMREVGILLIAFAPLDAAFSGDRPFVIALVLLFLGIGASLFTGAIMLERGRTSAD